MAFFFRPEFVACGINTFLTGQVEIEICLKRCPVLALKTDANSQYLLKVGLKILKKLVLLKF